MIRTRGRATQILYNMVAVKHEQLNATPAAISRRGLEGERRPILASTRRRISARQRGEARFLFRAERRRQPGRAAAGEKSGGEAGAED